MRDLPRFIKLGDDRINVEEIVAYGLKFYDDSEDLIEGDEVENEDVNRCLYVETKTSEFDFEYWEEDVDFDIDAKLVELDAIFLSSAFRTR